MSVEIEYTPIEGLLLIRPKIYSDKRGHFYENFNLKLWNSMGLPTDFAQENRSFSVKNTLRGLHFQTPPHGQGKLIQVLKGRVLDVAVDIRRGSKTYGQNFMIELGENDVTQMYIPEGFAHGFCALEDSVFNYKCTSYYEPSAEKSILWNDPDLNIDWGISNPILSVKDSEGQLFKDFVSPF